MTGARYPTYINADVTLDGAPCWVAQHPDLPGCAAHGDTIDEARALLDNARKAYVNYLALVGATVPPPDPHKPIEWISGRAYFFGPEQESR